LQRVFIFLHVPQSSPPLLLLLVAVAAATFSVPSAMLGAIPTPTKSFCSTCVSLVLPPDKTSRHRSKDVAATVTIKHTPKPISIAIKIIGKKIQEFYCKFVVINIE
jgi:hypothetical protein